MKNFFEGMRIAEERLSGLLETCGINASPREAAFIVAIVLTIICAIATAISLGTITGQNTILGKTYGEFHSGKAKTKLLSLGIAIVFGILTFLVFLIDGIANFKNTAMFFSYAKAIIMCIIIEAVAIFIGMFILSKNETKRDRKYEQKINTILSENPVYVEALSRIKNNDKIKMVIFFRDGISFHESVALPDDNKKEEISYYDKEFPEKGKNIALSTLGSVVRSSSQNRIKFSDYGYKNSESAMKDLYNYIFEATSPRFKRIEYTKEWTYQEPSVSSTPTGAIINGNTITFTGGSYKAGKREGTGDVLISCIMYDDNLSACDADSLKEW